MVKDLYRFRAHFSEERGCVGCLRILWTPPDISVPNLLSTYRRVIGLLQQIWSGGYAGENLKYM
jgi:hypothetical protein